MVDQNELGTVEIFKRRNSSNGKWEIVMRFDTESKEVEFGFSSEDAISMAGAMLSFALSIEKEIQGKECAGPLQ